jgi:hypothetical protein
LLGLRLVNLGARTKRQGRDRQEDYRRYHCHFFHCQPQLLVVQGSPGTSLSATHNAPGKKNQIRLGDTALVLTYTGALRVWVRTLRPEGHLRNALLANFAVPVENQEKYLVSHSSMGISVQDAWNNHYCFSAPRYDGATMHSCQWGPCNQGPDAERLFVRFWSNYLRADIQ